MIRHDMTNKPLTLAFLYWLGSECLCNASDTVRSEFRSEEDGRSRKKQAIFKIYMFLHISDEGVDSASFSIRHDPIRTEPIFLRKKNDEYRVY